MGIFLALFAITIGSLVTSFPYILAMVTHNYLWLLLYTPFYLYAAKMLYEDLKNHLKKTD